MNKISLADKVATIKNFKVFIFNGHDLDNKECYYLVACPPHKVEFIKNNDIDNLDQHAVVIDYGFGQTPSPQIKAMLKEQFDIHLDEAV